MATRQQRADYADCRRMLTMCGQRLASPTGQDSLQTLRALAYGFVCLYREAEALKVQVRGKPFDLLDVTFELDAREQHCPAYLIRFCDVPVGTLAAATGWFGDVVEGSDQPGWVLHFDDEFFAVLGLEIPARELLDVQIPALHQLHWQKVAWLFSGPARKAAQQQAAGRMFTVLAAAVDQR